MKKEFLNWSKEKEKIDKSDKKLIVKKREFWLFSIGVNLGNEESKDSPYIRPCLIINNYFKGDLVLVVPITSKYNEKLKDIYISINGNRYGLNKNSYMLINQIKVISKKRLIRKIGNLYDNNSFLDLVNRIKSLI